MGIKGALKKPLPKWEEILSYTGGGWSVFANEIPNLTLGKAFASPIRRDRHPSCALSQRDGVWYLKDFSTGESMTALQLVQKKYGLKFIDAVNKMAQEYGLLDNISKEYVIMPLQEAPVYEEMDIQCSFTDRKWRKEHYQFWDNTEVDEAHCRRLNVFAVKDLSWNRRIVKLKEREVVWAYWAEDIGKVKIYFPEREKGENKRFKTNIKGQYIWNLSNITECEKIITHKSVKDLVVSAVIFPCNIATQNESSSIFTPELVTLLNGLAKEIYIAYGSDDQGTQESIEITKANKYKWVNPPRKYLPEINDIFAMVKKYGIRELENLYKAKHII